MDIFSVLSVGLIVILVALSTYITNKSYRWIGTTFFKSMTIAFLFATCWSITHLLELVLIDGQDMVLLSNLASFSSACSWMFMAFLISSFEYAKKSPNRVLIEILFLISGIGFIFYFDNAFFTIELTSGSVRYVEEFPIDLLRYSFSIVGWVIMFPMIVSIHRTLMRNPSRFKKVRRILWMVGISGILMLMSLFTAQLSTGLEFLYTLSLISAVIFIGSFSWILNNHPTLFLATRHELVELIIVRKNTSLPLYSFCFKGEEMPINPAILSAFVTTAGHALQEAMNSKAYLQKFHFGESEAVISEGVLVYGIILTKSSSELLYSLLDIVITEFEARYLFQLADGHRTDEFIEFDSVIEKLFEFDVPKPPGSSES